MLSNKGLNAEDRTILRRMRIDKGGVVDLAQEKLGKKEKFKMSDILPDIYPYLFQLGDIILNILLEQCCKPKSSNNSRADYQTLPLPGPGDRVLSEVNNSGENRAKIRGKYEEKMVY